MAKEKLWQRHRQRIYFENEDMDFSLLWALGYQVYGGAQHGECFHAASRIADGNPTSWVNEWTDLARRVEAQAKMAADQGHRVSAREAYLRAATYYRFAAIFARPTDPQLAAAWRSLRSCFRQAAERFDPPIEAIAVAFDASVLPGYFMRADERPLKRPTLIMCGGGETFAEELYFWAGAPGVRRGYNVLFTDLPGQGGTPFAGLFLRPDTEVPIRAVVDYALTRPEVDPRRIALYGISGGGYMVTRAVAFEKRIAACIANAPIIDMHGLVLAEIPDFLQRAPAFVGNAVMKLAGRHHPIQAIALEKFLWQAGVSTTSEALEKARAAQLGPLVGEIGCPMLCMLAEGESEAQKAQAHQFYEMVSVPKALRVFTAAEGADAHCQVNNFSLQHQVVFDWLDEVLAR